ncbi:MULTISPECIES: cytochrome b [unclassified Alcanivorax]|jgi:cytochrome b561|uniref:cytochrome b n=1 Tax=unclassified Alcanivorax TaxID=2638842 RepID=UPI000789C764|nr:MULTISPECIES: cytochrome b [unclassified Alcanivorax]
MATKPTNWHPLHKGLHWLVVLLLVTVWGAVELHEFYEKSDPMREWWKMLHFSLGLTALVVMLIRLYGRALYPRPTPIGAVWQRQLSSLVHGLLYIVILAMPLSGFAMRQLAGKSIEIFGALTVPQLVTVNMDLAKQIAFIHKDVLWTILLTLVVIHIAGALWHHFINRDTTLQRMLPGKHNDTL